jgi:hypothetical protein
LWKVALGCSLSDISPEKDQDKNPSTNLKNPTSAMD